MTVHPGFDMCLFVPSSSGDKPDTSLDGSKESTISQIMRVPLEVWVSCGESFVHLTRKLHISLYVGIYIQGSNFASSCDNHTKVLEFCL